MPEITQLAARQLRDYDARTPGTMFAESISLDVREAYAIQTEVSRLREQRGERLIGYKVGCTSPTIQRQLNISHPVFGRLFDSDSWESKTDFASTRFASPAIEGELAVRLARDLPVDSSDEEIFDVIDSVFAVIELHNLVFRRGSPTAEELIANNAIHAFADDEFVCYLINRTIGTSDAALALLEEPDSLPVGVDAEASIGGSALAGVAFSGGLRERLLGRGGPVPMLVEPEAASAPPDLGDDSADTPEGDGVRVTVEDHTIADLASRLETSTLDLSRLSGVRPELVLPGISVWLLLRNPEAVEEFMRVSAYRGTATAQGLVGVTVWIDEWGSVEWSEITRSSGRPELDETALALFNEIASFRPAQDQGVRVSMSVIFTVAFPW